MLLHVHVVQTSSDVCLVFFFSLRPFIFPSDAPPDLEPHADYEEDNFNFAAPENMDANHAPNLTKLSEVAIQELDYYNFGKDVGSYNTA